MIDDDKNVLKRTVTGGEIWCFMYDPETKCQTVTWLSKKKNESSESENAKLASENNADCIFYVKVSFIMKLCRKNRL
jgi:hypothetical protein